MCATYWTFDQRLKHLMNVALPELIFDKNFIVDRVGLICNGAIKPFWFSSEPVVTIERRK